MYIVEYVKTCYPDLNFLITGFIFSFSRSLITIRLAFFDNASDWYISLIGLRPLNDFNF